MGNPALPIGVILDEITHEDEQPVI